MRPEIGLADLAAAFSALEVGSETAMQVVRLLDLAPSERRRARSVATASGSVGETEGSSPEVPRPQSETPRQGTPQRTSTDQARVALDVTSLAPMALSQPAWPAPVGTWLRRRGTQPPPLMSLLEPRLMPAILVGLSRTWRLDGTVDVAAMAEIIARRRIPRHVPRVMQPTLRMGVEVLVDRGEGMALFQADAEQLIAALKRVVGPAVAVRSFDETPLISGPGPRHTWTDYQPPPAGTPVLAVTDFGIANPTNFVDADWLNLRDRLRHSGCPFTALVPWPMERHPNYLRRSIPTLVWDRATTMGSLRAITRARTRR